MNDCPFCGSENSSLQKVNGDKDFICLDCACEWVEYSGGGHWILAEGKKRGEDMKYYTYKYNCRQCNQLKHIGILTRKNRKDRFKFTCVTCKNGASFWTRLVKKVFG